MKQRYLSYVSKVFKTALGSDLFHIDSKSGFDDRLGILPKYNIETPNIFCAKFRGFSQYSSSLVIF